MSNGLYTGITSGLSNGLETGVLDGLERGVEMNYDSNAVTPIVLYDFTQTDFYPNSGTSIIDLSGNNNSGVFVSSTGNGTPATVTGMTAGNPGYYNNTCLQRAVRLPNFCKFEGRTPYTICGWSFIASSALGVLPGAPYSSEGRNASNQAIGIQCFFNTSVTPISITYVRLNLGTQTGAGVVLAPPGAITLNKWLFTVIRYDGSIMKLDLFADGIRYRGSAPSSDSISVSPSWGAFLGLRYNMWLCGRIAYFSVFNRDIGSKNVLDIYNRTRTKLGV